MSQVSGDTNNHKAEGILIPSSCWGEDTSLESKHIEQKLLEIKNKIAPCKPRIIGVTKYFGLNAIINGYEAGIRDFGESRALEAIQKIESLPSEIRKNATFHFIGHLQSNKVEKVVQYFDYIHSVDSLKLAKTISDTACRLDKRERILLQVNNACEEQKSGFSVEQLRADFSEILKLDGVRVVGLMNIAPLMAGEAELRRLFRDIRNLRDELQERYGVEIPELSMGMSNDYEIAVDEGATMIRIGRMLFN